MPLIKKARFFNVINIIAITNLIQPHLHGMASLRKLTARQKTTTALFVSSSVLGYYAYQLGLFEFNSTDNAVFKKQKTYGNEFKIKVFHPTSNKEIGYARCSVANNTGLIHELYIAPRYRQQGLGSKLLSTAIDTIKKENADYIYLQVIPFEIKRSNYPGIISPQEREKRKVFLKDFYQHHGFEDDGYRMVKKLK